MMRYYRVTWKDREGIEQKGSIEISPHPDAKKVDVIRFYFAADLSSYTNYLSGEYIASDYSERGEDRPGRRAKRFLKSIGLKNAVVTPAKEGEDVENRTA